MRRRIELCCGPLLLLLIATLSAAALAQSGKPVRKKAPGAEAITVVHNPEPEYRSGEVSIAVRGNENPIIRLGLALTGVTLIEFPAADRFFAINPGGGDLITIEDSPTKETDHFFVIRAGTGFLPLAEGGRAASPATSIIVQMSSGMSVTFLLYAVRTIEENAHRCVVTYDRDAIVKARQAAGLATNLDRREEKPEAKTAAGLSRRILSPEPAPEPSAQPPAPIPADAGQPKQEPPKEEQREESPLADRRFPGAETKWSERCHGLRIAVQPRMVNEKQRQVLIAVHNTLEKTVQLVPGYPELYIHTLNNKGRILHAESLKPLKVESASADGVIAPGKILRFLITYETPVLGVRQRLGIAVAQTQAADEPVMMDLYTEDK